MSIWGKEAAPPAEPSHGETQMSHHDTTLLHSETTAFHGDTTLPETRTDKSTKTSTEGEPRPPVRPIRDTRPTRFQDNAAITQPTSEYITRYSGYDHTGVLASLEAKGLSQHHADAGETLAAMDNLLDQYSPEWLTPEALARFLRYKTLDLQQRGVTYGQVPRTLACLWQDFDGWVRDSMPDEPVSTQKRRVTQSDNGSRNLHKPLTSWVGSDGIIRSYNAVLHGPRDET